MEIGVFTGLTNIDIAYYGDELPLENKKIKTTEFVVYIGGPAANAAITYSILGGKARLITCIGDSAQGRELKKQLSLKYNIDVIDMAKGQSVAPSTSSIFINSETGTRTIWSGQTRYLVKNESYEKYLKDARFIFSDCNLQEVSLPCVRAASALKKPVILDCGSWKENMDEFLKMASVAIASEDCISPWDDSFFNVASRYNVHMSAVTHGDKAVEFRKGNGEIQLIEPQRCISVDTLGAGDIFHGAYCYYSFVKSLEFYDSLKVACEVASESVKHRGPRTGVEIIVSMDK